MTYAALDFETAYYGKGSACSLGIAVGDGKKLVDTWYRLIRPQSLDFDPRCVKVNQIRPEDVEQAPEFPFFWKDIADRLEGATVFAHNAPFDMGVLAATLDMYDLPDLHFFYGDTVKISRILWKQMANHKLNTVAGLLGFDFQHHQAMEDAKACEFIVRKAIEATGAKDARGMMDALKLPLTKFTVKRTHVQAGLFG